MRYSIGLLLCALGVAFAALNIDDLTIGQLAIEVNTVGTTMSSFVGGATSSIIGGERDFVLTAVDDDTIELDNIGKLVSVTTRRAIQFSVDDSITCIAEIQWDGIDASAAFNPTGLGGIDFIADGNTGINWRWIQSDIPVVLNFEITDMVGGSSTFLYSNAGRFTGGGSNLVLHIPFSSFSGNTDFRRVGAVRITVEPSTSIDMLFGELSVTKLHTFTKSASVSSIAAGNVITYSIVVTNIDDALNITATGITVSDAPDSLTTLNVGSVTVTQNGAPLVGALVIRGNNAGNTDVLVNLPALDDGASATVTFSATVTQNFPCLVNTISNRANATIFGVNVVSFDVSGSNSTTTTVTGSPSLNISSTLSGPNNGFATYTLRTCNNGNRQATEAIFSVTAPSLTQVVVENGWSAGSPATLSVGTIDVGTCVTRTVRLQIVGPLPCAPQELTPSFTITETCGPSSHSTTGPSFTVIGHVDINLTVIPSVSSAGAGEVVDVTVCVANIGTSTSPGASLTLNFDDNQAAIVNANGRCAVVANGRDVCTDSLPAISAGGRQCLTFSFRVKDSLACLDTLFGVNVTVTELCLSIQRAAAASVTLTGTPVLSVTKTYAGSGLAIPGGLVPFDVCVYNTGTRSSGTITITDIFDSSLLTPIDSTGCSNGQCSVTTASVTAGNFICRRFTFTLSNPVDCDLTSFTNNARAQEDCASSSDSDSADVDVDAFVSLTISKSVVGATEVRPGETINYNIQVRNTGNQIASTVTITETVPQYTTAVPPAGWSCSGASCTYTITNFAPSSTATSIAFAVEVDDVVPPELDEINNSASVVSADPCDASATSEADVTVLSNPDLVVRKTLISQQPIQAGSQAIFDITWWNLGDVASLGAFLVDEIPEFTSIDLSINSAWTCTGTSVDGVVYTAGTCTFQIGRVNPGSQNSVSVIFTIDSCLPCDVDLTVNSVSIDDDGSQGEDVNPEDNFDIEFAELTADSVISVSVVPSATEVYAGDEVTFTVTVESTGTRVATGISLSVTIPPYTTPVDVAWTCDDDNCVYNEVITSLGCTNISTFEANFTVKVDDTLPAGVDSTTITANATETCQFATDEASVTIELIAAPDIKVCKKGGVQVITYMVDVLNHGSRGAEGTVLHETVPEGTTFAPDLSDERWVCQDSGSCTLTLGELEVGQGDTAIFSVYINDRAITCTVYENQVYATITNGPDLNEADNEDSVIITVAPDDRCSVGGGSCECSCEPVMCPTLPEGPIECTSTTCEAATCEGCEGEGSGSGCGCGCGNDTTINFDFSDILGTD